jgi:hypothetical protein
MVHERLVHLNAEFRRLNARLEDIPPDNLETTTIEDIRAAFQYIQSLTQELQLLQAEYTRTEAYVANS